LPPSGRSCYSRWWALVNAIEHTAMRRFLRRLLPALDTGAERLADVL
jgi:hypothetical protein